MNAWRLAKVPHKSLDGIGGEYAEGRWHMKGQRIVYTASSPSLAVLENLVHLDLLPDLMPDDYVLLDVEIPDGVSTEHVSADSLADGWNAPDSMIAKEFGSRWLDETRTAVLLVPSAVISTESNILINPRHAEAGRIRIAAERPFRFDPRLLKQGGG